jgi:hypothetical protein
MLDLLQKPTFMIIIFIISLQLISCQKKRIIFTNIKEFQKKGKNDSNIRLNSQTQVIAKKK